MIRTCVSVVLLASLVLLLPAAGNARAEVLLVHGTLASDPMPEGYRFELAVLALREGKPEIEVVGKSCTGTPSEAAPASCQRTSIFFSVPPAVVIENKKAYYRGGNLNLNIGDVIGLGSVSWVRLRRGAVLEATTTVARVKLDTTVLAGRDGARIAARDAARAARFGALHRALD
jgi:hypothetical protein